jgi:Na+-driven multidrug efflux pump
LGLVGAAWAVIAYNIVTAILLVNALRIKGSPFKTSFAALWPDPRLTKIILRVAIPSAINNLQSNLTFLSLTALVAPFGTAGIAGYGMGGRLEFLLIPIVFGIGSALIPLISANAGAGRFDRVRQATRAGLVLGASTGLAIGMIVACFPGTWMRLFSNDPAILDIGSSYLRIVGPAYVGFGGGLVCFFAAQGSGRVVPSLAAGFTRLLVAAIGGYIATRVLGYGTEALFSLMAAGLLLYGTVMVYVVRRELGLVRSEQVVDSLNSNNVNMTSPILVSSKD